MVFVINIFYIYRKLVKGYFGFFLKDIEYIVLFRIILLLEEWNLIYMFLYSYSGFLYLIEKVSFFEDIYIIIVVFFLFKRDYLKNYRGYLKLYIRYVFFLYINFW